MAGSLKLPHPKDAGQPSTPGCRLQEAVIEAIKNVIRDELLVHLFSNDVRPGKAVTLASFREVTGRGYAPKLLAPSLWSLARNPKGFRVFSYGKHVVFEFSGTGALVIYGFFVTRARDGALMWADRLHPPGAEPIDYDVYHNPGDALILQPAAPIWMGGL